MNAGQVPVFELICPRFWMEQAKKLEIYKKQYEKQNIKNCQKWECFEIFVTKLRVLNLK